MAQKRYLNFGDDVTASSLNAVRAQTFNASVLSGGAFSALNNQLVIEPIAVCLPSGIVVVEDAVQYLSLSDVPDSAARSYTIVYTHNDQNIIHGNAAVLEAVNNILSPNDLPNSTILGWVKYPGGNVALSSEHFVTTRLTKVIAAASKYDRAMLGAKLPPFSSKFLHHSSSGGLVTITDVCDKTDPSHVTVYTQLSNTSGLDGQVTKVLPFLVGEFPPNLIVVDSFVDLNAYITLSIIDATGEEVAPLNGQITNTTAFVTREFTLPSNYYWLFASGSTFLVKLVLDVPVGKLIKLRSVSYSTYNLPF